MTAFDAVRDVVRSVKPRAAVVLGSGLGDAARAFVPVAAAGYEDVPGLVPPTVVGHRGQLAVGHWGDVPAVVCSGRVHFYEGHAWERVVRLVHLLAEFGVSRLVLTNAAGGIRDDLNPGDLMALSGHLTLLDAQAWRTMASASLPPSIEGGPGGGQETARAAFRSALLPPPLSKGGPGGVNLGQPTPPGPPLEKGGEESRPPLNRGGEKNVPYTLLAAGLPTGVYAAVTGPCYETPAEIRALRAVGADAVGMSTAKEAEAAVGLGMQVAGVSCITNKAAGLSAGTLSHHDVEHIARTAVNRLADVLAGLLAGA